MERNIFEKQRELNDRLNRYRDEYYNRNAPSVSDEVYDRLFDELKELEQETGIQMANSPTQTVGYPAVSRLEKTRHEIPLLSLDKTKSSMVLLNFMGEQQVMLIPSVCCQLINGERAETGLSPHIFYGRFQVGGILMHIDRIPVYRVYQRAIDLELYHAFAELVVQTSQDDTARRTYRQTRAMQIWQVETDVSGYFEPYHLRYPGEVLERFEEKLGDDVQVFRALALALGNTCAIQSDNMFVGNQRGAFLQKLRRSAGEDVYLQGALYLLETDAAQRHALLEKLAEREYMRTEEALFVLSLFDDTERGYEAMHTQLSRLFTQNRTLSLVYDFGVLEWFIRFYAEQAKKYRGKADLVLRTLMKLPYMNVKPDSREFSVLTKAGYRCDEIILANSLAVWADRLPDRLSSKSITAEKIAAACGRMLLNAPKDLSEEFYEYLGWLFRFYDSFTVKYEGFQGLWEAVQYGLNPTAPKTLLWMNQTIQKDFPYRFDVFDPQYDDLAKELERDNYMELFTLQMLHSRQAIPLKQWLSRYQELTGADYGEYFRSCHKNSGRAFAFLVERKEIDLWEFFEQHRDGGEYAPQLKLLREYALRISSWRCFRFVERLLAEYTFPHLQTIFGERFYFHECFVRSEGYYSRREYKTYISRPFLTAEQQRQLYDWVELSFFQTEPEKYEDFVLSALKAPEIQRLYDKKALAAVLRQFFLHSEYNGYEINRLKETFYSKEELEDERRSWLLKRCDGSYRLN